MNKKTLKKVGILGIGLMIWTVFLYISIAFLKVESNPFVWEESVRGTMLFAILVYIIFIPLMMMSLGDDL